MVDILKISDEELVLLTGTDDLEKGSAILAENGIKLIMITLGSEGVFYREGEVTGTVPAEKVTVADTNGAGDTFLGGVLSKLAPMSEFPQEDELRSILAFANRAAAKTCSRPGAIPAMPTLEELGDQHK